MTANDKDGEYNKTEREIKEFIDQKLRGKNYLFTMTFTEPDEKEVKYKTFYHTNTDPGKKTYAEVYPLANLTLQLFDAVGRRFFPQMRTRKV